MKGIKGKMSDMDKKEVFFVILNLKNLNFEDEDGYDVLNIESAKKFYTFEDAVNALKEYDDDFIGKIYRVNRRTYCDFKLESEN